MYNTILCTIRYSSRNRNSDRKCTWRRRHRMLTGKTYSWRISTMLKTCSVLAWPLYSMAWTKRRLRQQNKKLSSFAQLFHGGSRQGNFKCIWYVATTVSNNHNRADEAYHATLRLDAYLVLLTLSRIEEATPGEGA